MPFTHAKRPDAKGSARSPVEPPVVPGRAQPQGNFAQQSAQLSPRVQSKKAGKRAGNETNKSTTDPRLAYTDASERGLDATHLPFYDGRFPGNGWNAPEILSHITQVDETKTTYSDSVRCGANAVLATAIMAGPTSVLKLIDRLLGEAQRMIRGGTMKRRGLTKTAKWRWSQQRREEALNAALRSMVSSIRIMMETATYEDLSQVAHTLKLVMTARTGASTTGADAMKMGDLVGHATSINKDHDQMQYSMHRLKSKDDVRKAARDLAPGAAFVVTVDTDVFKSKRAVSEHANHMATLGREPGTKRGEDAGIYLYDPYPRKGKSQYMKMDEPDFWLLFVSADGRMKYSQIMTMITPDHIDDRSVPGAEQSMH